MRTFGGFRSGDRFFYGEIRGDEVRVLKNPFWIDMEPTGEIARLTNVVVDLPVAPSKLIAVGLNYSDHIAEMKRTPLGTPLIWFKSPNSLLPHAGTIEIAFPEHQTDFEAELAVIIGRSAKNVLQSERWILFSGTQLVSISAIEICKRPRSNLAAANHSTPIPRLGRLFMLMST